MHYTETVTTKLTYLWDCLMIPPLILPLENLYFLPYMLAIVQTWKYFQALVNSSQHTDYMPVEDSSDA